jgi:transcriptional regulatory protein LevR/transcriptional regulator with AAA-type ATPase domain
MKVKAKKNEEVILDYLHKLCTEENAAGCSAGEIADAIGMQRTNVSTVLNKLYDAGKLVKIKGKPVLYSVKTNMDHEQQSKSNFDSLIGSNKSLQKCIQRAKAAMLYPPHGLHTIILGPTGVGKTMFAEMMYNFAVENGVYSPSAPFIPFNCADYANNPQLLLAQLFGCKKGAFTGADKDRAGVVEKADGGVLFLDEVHRLPPEGQEMLFYLIDKGQYSALGDVDNKKKSEVLIICATTEEIDSSLLSTFTRRIPMNICLPALKDRTIEERFELVCEFFKVESRRIGREIVVSTNTLRSLLLYHCNGNIGQLRSDIQLGCANAFLKCVSKREKSILLHSTDFSHPVRQGLILYKNHADEVDKLLKADAKLSFKPNKDEEVVEIDAYILPKNFYEDIEKRIQELQQRGVNEQDINFIMSFDIENYFKKFIRNFAQGVNKEELSKVVDQEIIVLVEKFLGLAGEKLRKVFPVKVFYGLCLHMKSSIERIREHKEIVNHNINDIMEKYPDEYSAALQFAVIIEGQYKICVPVDEVGFIAMFLTVDDAKKDVVQKPIVVVAAHGKSTAASLVEVAANLAGADNLYAYDMPLDKNPKAAYEEIKALILKNHQGAGVLLLVDMGAFNMFGELISEETGLEIKVLDMVSTLIVIECARKIASGSTISEVIEDIKNSNSLFMNYTTSVSKTLLPEKDHIIITLCTTGEGSALKIQSMLEERLDIVGKNIQFMPMSISDKEQLLVRINKLSKEKTIIAVVGTFDPDIYGIPFIPVSALFETDNLARLGAVVENVERDNIYHQVFTALEQEMDMLDAAQYRNLFSSFINELQVSLERSLELESVIGLIMHLACAIQRLKRGESCPQCMCKDELKQKYNYVFLCIKQNITAIEKFYEVYFSEDELWYILRIIMNI